MHHAKKKSAINKYSEAIKADQSAAETQMREDGLSDDDIFIITEAVNGGEQPAETKTEKATNKPSEKVGLNPIYEKWKIGIRYELDEDREPVTDKKGRTIPIFEKEKLIRTCKISDEQAEILNSQSRNTKERYYVQE